ncbi:protein CcmA, bactofilin family [Microbulbifer donghaiensis]|uniref:Protein CcmA, bactofilin family n=1 Tax=Microbulbifer donghaiensis TaxID=494016 RepID=A0A1M5D889_9GAMM|nr:polymer-forming cytoskeletal protein [Microbulbifer donghaiensis]SHF63243.1 protein CcmA, bactofilin family [Microbulbifer donghaiensis]
MANDEQQSNDESSNSFLDGFMDQGSSAPQSGSHMGDDFEKSVIGKNIKFRGELIGNESLHIEGTIEGTVIMEGHNLSVGAGGELNANIHAKNITVEGALTGDALAEELIEIRRTAVVKGNLTAPRIQLDDGGKFRGSMDMVDTDAEMKERINEFKEKLVHPSLPPRDAEGVTKAASSSSGLFSTSAAADYAEADLEAETEA